MTLALESAAATPRTKDHARAYKQELVQQMFGTQRRRTRGAAATAAGALEALGAEPPEPLQIPAYSNVQGVGFGAKVTTGAGLHDLAVRVYVRAKQPRSMLTKKETIPDQINGMPTDVIPVGDIHAAVVMCGVSVGHVKVSAGTIGCIVTRDGDPDKRFILSNNHILANSNDAQVEDRILQPGKLDGGKPPHIARLTEWEPLLFDGRANAYDAAIAELLDAESVTPELEVIGPMSEPVTEPAVYQSVRKHGRTTLHTLGVIMDLAADIRVRYGNRVAWFEDQLTVTGVNGWFADRGDSGSLVIDAVTRRPVALLFAVASGNTFCSPIEPVLERFGAKIAFRV